MLIQPESFIRRFVHRAMIIPARVFSLALDLCHWLCRALVFAANEIDRSLPLGKYERYRHIDRTLPVNNVPTIEQPEDA